MLKLTVPDQSSPRVTRTTLTADKKLQRKEYHFQTQQPSSGEAGDKKQVDFRKLGSQCREAERTGGFVTRVTRTKL